MYLLHKLRHQGVLHGHARGAALLAHQKLAVPVRHITDAASHAAHPGVFQLGSQILLPAPLKYPSLADIDRSAQLRAVRLRKGGHVLRNPAFQALTEGTDAAVGQNRGRENHSADDQGDNSALDAPEHPHLFLFHSLFKHLLRLFLQGLLADIQLLLHLPQLLPDSFLPVSLHVPTSFPRRLLAHRTFLCYNIFVRLKSGVYTPSFAHGTRS